MTGAFDYFCEGAPAEPSEATPGETYHRAPKGIGTTICGMTTSELQPVISDGHPGILAFLCERGCRLGETRG